MTGLARLVAWSVVRRPLRLGLAAVAVAAGLSVWSGVAVTNHSIDVAGQRAVDRLAGPGRVRVVGPTLAGGLSPGDVATLRARYGRTAVVPVISDVSTMVRADGSRASVMVLGIDCSWPGAAALGCRGDVLDRVGTAPLAVGRGIDRRPGAHLWSDVGPISLDGPAPVRSDLDALNGGRVVVLGLPGAGRALTREGAVDSVFVRGPTSDDAALVREIRRLVPRARSITSAGEEWPEVRQLLATVRPAMDLMSLLALVVVGLVCASVVRAEVDARRSELAVAAAVGAEPRRIGVLATAPAVLAGLTGGAVGAAAGAVSARPMLAAVNSVTEGSIGLHVDPRWNLGALAGSLLLGALVALVAGVLATRRIAVVDVAGELGDRPVTDEPATDRWGLVTLVGISIVGAIGVVAAVWDSGLEPWQARVAGPALAVLIVGLLVGWSAAVPVTLGWRSSRRVTRPASLWLARTNIRRDARLRGLGVLAIVATVALATVTGSLVASVTAHARRTAAGADYLATTGRVSDAVVQAIDVLPGAGRRTEVRSRMLVRAGELVQVKWAVAGTQSFATIDGAPTDTTARIGSATARLARVRGGDSLTLEGIGGKRRLPVGGVWDDGAFGARNVTVDAATGRTLFGSGQRLSVRWYPRPGVPAGELRQQVRRALGSDAPVLRSRDEDLQHSIAEARAVVAPFVALQFSLVAASLVIIAAVATTLVRQRGRELATLLAVGVTPARIVATVTGEAAIVGTAAAVCGGALGATLSVAVLRVAPFWLGPRLPVEVDAWGAAAAGAVLVMLVVGIETAVAARVARSIPLDRLREL